MDKKPWDFFVRRRRWDFLGPKKPPELHLHGIIELDDGKILTGKPDQFDGKFTMVSGEDFPQETNPLIMLRHFGFIFSLSFHSSSCQILPDSARFCQILGMLKHMGSETHEAMLEAREVEGKAQQVDGWQPVTQCTNDAGLLRRIHPNSWAHLYLWEPD